MYFIANAFNYIVTIKIKGIKIERIELNENK